MHQAADNAANTGTQSGFPVTVDNTAPAGSDVQTANGGSTPGRPEQGDIVTFTFTEQIDPASVHALCALRDELAKQGIELRLAEVHHRARERLILEGLEAAVGPPNRRFGVPQVVDEYASRSRT